MATTDSTYIASQSTPSVEGILDAFPDELVRGLARLHGQPDDVVTVALSTLRYGSRTTLANAGVIDGLASAPDKADQVVLTDYGRSVIAACAGAYERGADDEQRAKAELDRAREQWIGGRVDTTTD